MSESSSPPSGPDLHSPAVLASLRRYWRSNLRILAVLLLIWAAASLGAGILFAAELNQFTIPGTALPLGFWFAHQGSIVIFVFVILFYCIFMNSLDRKHHRELEAIREKEKQS
jgi:putative solute:sodium symporter small subunit